jgi:hypothetical protein
MLRFDPNRRLARFRHARIEQYRIVEPQVLRSAVMKDEDLVSSRPSFIALNRIVEERAANDAAFRRTLERNGKPLLSQARQLTDAALLERLRRLGIELDKTSYAEIAEHAHSAEEMARTALTAEVLSRCKHRFDEDWVWLALTVLWERWFPQWPNLEQLDDRIQAGYAFQHSDPLAACEPWLQAWEGFLILYDAGSFKSMGEFDDMFAGTQLVSNWTRDLEMALGNAAIKDSRWHERRIRFCDEFLRWFPNEDGLTRENMRRALAESIFGTGDRARGDALFEQWLKDDPQWGWGWIGWSDCHWLFATGAERDARRAEALLKQGLDAPGVRDRADLLERLAELSRERGRHEDADRFQEESDAARRADAGLDDSVRSRSCLPGSGGEGLLPDELPHTSAPAQGEHGRIPEPAMLARSRKIGRNEPCPCGSGKKYKKCCLAKDKALARQAAASAPPPDGEDEDSPQRRTAEDPHSGQGRVGEDMALSPEVESKLNQAWKEFEALRQPAVDQMEGFLSQLLALPAEATSWGDILHRFARLKHPDLPAVFRRIVAAVAPTSATDMAFFYWAAAEEFARHGIAQMLPEVAAGFRRLDVDTYDADALSHVEDFLLAGGFEAESLELAEHFLPVERADAGLMPYAVLRRCSLIFELRLGRALRGGPSGAAPPDFLARELRQDIEDETHEDTARLAAGIAAGVAPALAWARPQFELVTGDIHEDDKAWQDWLRLFGMLLRVAQEAWLHDARPPGCALRGLTLLLNSVCDWKDQRAKESKRSSDNLLDYLRPAGLESRLVQSCRDMIGINVPRARLLLQAHELLARLAARHDLVSPAEAAQTAKTLSRLRRQLDALEQPNL